MTTLTKGLWVSLEAKPGKEADVARFLEGGRSLVEDEPTRPRGSRSGSATRSSPLRWLARDRRHFLAYGEARRQPSRLV